MDYDKGTETLYWADGNGHTIWKLPLSNDSKTIEPVLKFEKDVPYGVAISFCKRYKINKKLI